MKYVRRPAPWRSPRSPRRSPSVPLLAIRTGQSGRGALIDHEYVFHVYLLYLYDGWRGMKCDRWGAVKTDTGVLDAAGVDHFDAARIWVKWRDACPVPIHIVSPSSLDPSKVGKLAAAPWGRDQKLAALAAWSVMEKHQLGSAR